jgi:uncharacterized protein (TIGR03032 family)
MAVNENKLSDDDFYLDYSSRASDNFAGILSALNISLLVSSYQSNAVFVLSGKNGQLHCEVKPVNKPMGLYADSQRITLSSYNGVHDFILNETAKNNIESGYLDSTERLPKKLQIDEALQQDVIAQAQAIKQSDALYCERFSLVTGVINIHDIAWGQQGLWAVNSSFSCLSTLDATFGFVARWKPEFISKIAPENRCHLNGMAMKDGAPRFVTTFGKGDSKESWRDGATGTLIDTKSNEILLDQLTLPHSPKYDDGYVYFCDSGHGSVNRFNLQTKSNEVIATLPGFTRAIKVLDDLLIVGTSAIRKSEVKRQLPATDYQLPIDKNIGAENSICGIWILNKATGEQIAHLHFDGEVTQIYDIAVIPYGSPCLVESAQAIASHLFYFSEELAHAL